ncbi:hypothetical protein PSI19_17640 [Xenorhabdus khoisanae]|uniref:T3SS effector EspK n=1 Tax=Xenorhabdus khoisanae TaxID=880157 RepID=A0A0J5FNA3_9GAMM|nr:hypothetical protein [Xenorhabdus khoisanae]KMJ43781.1 hypothetical protein AB204_17765 [Xenorhabdus khoisanae]MDC9615656.1 hypothetical protein [Xenorhabdus khoisanae]
MPFKEPFTRKFITGDLIYGLHHERVKYTKRYEPFKGIKISMTRSNIRAVTIDQYVVPPELSLEDGAIRTQNMRTTKKLPYHKSFTSHLDNHPKYHTALTSASEEGRGKIFSRKCKGGLSWITSSIGHNDLVKKNSIHFILDGIDMNYVVNKKIYPGAKNDITAHELRWIYRKRKDINVQEKIQFWLNGQPTVPPWESDEGKKIWRRYTPMTEIEEAFNSSLPIKLYF